VKPRPLTSLLLGAIATLAVPQPALGQNAPAPKEAEEEEDEDVIIVQGTRLGRRLQDEPLRVEVIAGEEIEEKALMRPGNIAMLVNEIGGIRVQVTAPALGAANVRIQGLEGRYTQLLADNLPLYGGQASGLGLLQVPPTDLAQVEVIKGSVSALYGGSALGGVINLVSKRPGAAFEADILANATSRNGQDLTAYLAGPVSSRAGLSLTAGVHRRWVAGYGRVRACDRAPALSVDRR
jgi:outer membrane receptor for ferrienterochelin and colicins